MSTDFAESFAKDAAQQRRNAITREVRHLLETGDTGGKNLIDAGRTIIKRILSDSRLSDDRPFDGLTKKVPTRVKRHSELNFRFEVHRPTEAIMQSRLIFYPGSDDVVFSFSIVTNCDFSESSSDPRISL